MSGQWSSWIHTYLTWVISMFRTWHPSGHHVGHQQVVGRAVIPEHRARKVEVRTERYKQHRGEGRRGVHTLLSSSRRGLRHVPPSSVGIRMNEKWLHAACDTTVHTIGCMKCHSCTITTTQSNVINRERNDDHVHVKVCYKPPYKWYASSKKGSFQLVCTCARMMPRARATAGSVGVVALGPTIGLDSLWSSVRLYLVCFVTLWWFRRSDRQTQYTFRM